MDLVDLANHEQVRDEAKAVFDRFDDDMKFLLCREITIDQICILIEKFPIHTQKEIIALLTDRFMRKWKDNEKQKTD